MEYAQDDSEIVAKGKLPIVSPTQLGGAAPYVQANQMVQGLLEQHLLPRTIAFQQAAQVLARSLAQPGTTAWAKHRPLWVQTMLAWETLAAVAVGPLLERRSARTIDFWPTRPAQIQRLLQSGLGNITTVPQLDTIGASARGLPALEWLLWKTDGSDHAQPYASLLAQQIEAESTVLLTGYKSLSVTKREVSDAWILYSEWFGQAVGGLNQLRFKKMVPDSRGKDSALWVRGVSGQTAACWQAQAQGLQAFFIGGSATQATTEIAKSGDHVTGSLDSMLLNLGYVSDSQALRKLTTNMLRTVQAARHNKPTSIRAAQTALGKISALINGLAGDELNISLGFTDADGD